MAQIEIASVAVKQYPDLVSSLECALPGNKTHWDLPRIFRQPLTCPLIIGYACSGAHTADPNKPFAHTVSSGFEWQQHQEVLAIMSPHHDNFCGVVFQIPWEQQHLAAMQIMQHVFSGLPLTAQISLRLAPANPATSNFDDDAICNRITSALSQLEHTPNLQLQLDTSSDIDRGYSPRHGLVDRLYNIRQAGRQLMAI